MKRTDFFNLKSISLVVKISLKLAPKVLLLAVILFLNSMVYCQTQGKLKWKRVCEDYILEYYKSGIEKSDSMLQKQVGYCGSYAPNVSDILLSVSKDYNENYSVLSTWYKIKSNKSTLDYCDSMNLQIEPDKIIEIPADIGYFKIHWKYSFDGINNWTTILGYIWTDFKNITLTYSDFEDIPDIFEKMNVSQEFSLYIRSEIQFFNNRQCNNFIVYSHPLKIKIEVPPQIESEITSPACLNQPNGSLTIKFQESYFKNFSIQCGSVDLGSKTIFKGSKTITFNSLESGENRYRIQLSDGCSMGDEYIVIPQYNSKFISEPKLQNFIVCPDETVKPLTIKIKDGKPGYTISSCKKDNGSFNNPKTYGTWENPEFAFDNLTKGKYVLTVKDQCGIFDIATINVVAPKPDLNFKPTSASCNDPFNGQISITANSLSGVRYLAITEIYTNKLLLRPPDPFTNKTFKASVSGTYAFKTSYQIVANSKNCTINSDSYTLSKAPTPNVNSFTPANPSCYGYNNGSITVNSNLNNLRMHVEGKNATGNNSTYTILNLSAGNYPVYFKRNLANCTDSFPYNTIELKNPPEVKLLYQKEDACSEEGYGWIKGLLTESQNGGSGISFHLVELGKAVGGETEGIDFDPLSSGKYTLKAQQIAFNKCVSKTDTLTIYEKFRIDSIYKQTIACFGDKATINISPKGAFSGSGKYQFNFSYENKSFSLTDTGKLAVDKGNYILKYKDRFSTCPEKTTNFKIAGSETLLKFHSTASVNRFGYHVACFGDSSGIIQLNSSGGGQNHNYQVMSAKGPQSFQGSEMNNLSAGSYHLSLSDNFGCVRDTIITLIQPAQLVSMVTGSKAVNCTGDSSGYLAVKSIGGLAPYHYALTSSGQYVFCDTIRNLSYGEYQVYARDSAGCINQFLGEILSLMPPIEIKRYVTDVSCNGKQDGGISIFPISDTALYKYRWANDTGNKKPFLDGLLAGKYVLTVTDTFKCSKTYSIEVSQPDVLCQSGTILPVCWGETFGGLHVVAQGGTPPYMYQQEEKTTEQSYLAGLESGEHTITITDKNGCTQTASYFIPSKIVPVFSDFLVASYVGLQDTAMLVDISLPKPDSVHWHLDPAMIVVDTSSQSPMVMFPFNGNFKVDMDCFYDGCAYVLSKNIQVTNEGESTLKSMQLRGLKSLNVTPNPTHGRVRLEIETYGSINFSVFVKDILGNEYVRFNVPPTELYDYSFNLPNLISGVYVVTAVSSFNSLEQKIVVQ